MSDPSVTNPGDPTVTDPQATPPAVPTTPVANPGTTTDWESSYKGLQATYNKLFNDHRVLEGKYNALVAENEKVKQENTRTATELGTATSGLQVKDQEIKKHLEEIETHKAKYDRLQLIAEKFPSLLVMEQQGLLPAMDLKDLEPKLAAIQQSLSKAIDDKTKNSLQAAPPGPVSSNNNLPPVEGKDEIYDKLVKLAGSKKPEDRAEYERLNALYQHIDDKKE